MHVERETPALTLSKPAGDPGLISAVGEVSPHWISAAGDVLEHPGPEKEEDDGFDFAFVVGDPDLSPDITVADDIFSHGRIRPVYPVFNRRDLLLDSSSSSKAVLIEDREACSVSTSSSSTGVVAENSPGPYCVWTPRSVPSSPDRCKKSNSTGTATRPWRLRDVFDGRSHSDGKEKFLFLAPPEKEKEKKRPDPRASPSREAAAAKGKGTAKGNTKVTEMDMVTAHRLYYAKGSSGAGAGARRSFLPYKRNLVGFFVNPNPF